MGRASSNKKVARVAGTGGGRTGSSNTPWSYFGLIALIVVVGVALTYTSRQGYINKKHHPKATAAAAPKVGTTWYTGLGVYTCGTWQAPIKKTTSPTGLTALGNGVMKISPKTKAVAGHNATLGAWAKAVGLDLTGTSIKLPDGKTYSNGDKCDGKAGTLYVMQFPYVGAAAGTLQTAKAPDVRLANNVLLTVAFVPSSDKGKIPPPPQSVQRALKHTVASATTTTTTTPTTTAPTTTAPSTTSTTAKSSSTGKSTKSHKK
ncbi:MAG TPA: hypothetical protein VKV06_00450 [Acidimicrobiales bacterium]|nr:hypothetical protein [Acidimicrobiales bacterium]